MRNADPPLQSYQGRSHTFNVVPLCFASTRSISRGNMQTRETFWKVMHLSMFKSPRGGGGGPREYVGHLIFFVESPYPGKKLYRITEYLAVLLWILLHFRDIKVSSLPQIRCSFLSFIITNDNLEMTVLFNIKFNICAWIRKQHAIPRISKWLPPNNTLSKKVKHPHLRAQTLNQIPEGGRYARGPPPPLGLTLIGA